jgi:hypothetical protein
VNFTGVAEQVPEHLLHTLAVTRGAHRRLRSFDTQLDALRVG